MRYTPFAGLTELDSGESLSENDYAVTGSNIAIIDRLLQIGAKTHRHDDAAPFPDPTTPPTLSAGTGGSGQLGPGLNLSFSYTVLDTQGNETGMSEVAVITTSSPIDPPQAEPTATVDTSAGALRSGVYYYALSLKDAMGGETPVGISFPVTFPAGSGDGRVNFSGLSTVKGSAAKWRIYRSDAGGRLQYLGEGTGDTFTDDGIACVTTITPTTTNTTNGNNYVALTIPTVDAGATGINVYLSEDGSFTSPCLYGAIPLASAGSAMRVDTILVGEGAPPAVSNSVGGAHKIGLSELDSEVISAIGSGGSGPSGPGYISLVPAASGTGGGGGGTGGAMVNANLWGSVLYGSVDTGFLVIDGDLGPEGYGGYYSGTVVGPGLPAAPSRKATMKFKTNSSGSPKMTPDVNAAVFFSDVNHWTFDANTAYAFAEAGGIRSSLSNTQAEGGSSDLGVYTWAASTDYWLGLEMTATEVIARAWTADPGPDQSIGTPVATVTKTFASVAPMDTTPFMGTMYPTISYNAAVSTATTISQLQFSPSVGGGGGGGDAGHLIIEMPGVASATIFNADGRSPWEQESVTVGASAVLYPKRLEFVAGSGIKLGMADDGDGGATITIGLI